MYRRRFTRSMIGGVVTCTAPLAGCTGGKTVRDCIDEAAELLAQNDETLSRVGQQLGDDATTASFDDDVVRGRVDEAFESLDTAEELGPTEDEQAEIEALRQIGDAQLALTDFFVRFIEFVAAFEAAREHWDAQRFDDALEALVALEPEIDLLETDLEEVEAAFAAIDREPFDPEDRNALAEADREIELMADRLAGFAVLVEGFIPFTRANVAFQEGNDRYGAQDYEGAIERYDEALVEANRAHEIFSDAVASPPLEEIDFEGFVCTSERLLELVGYMKGSARAYLDGNEGEAEQLREQAVALLEGDGC